MNCSRLPSASLATCSLAPCSSWKQTPTPLKPLLTPFTLSSSHSPPSDMEISVPPRPSRAPRLQKHEGENGTFNTAARANIANFCLICAVAFTTIACAKQHVRKSFKLRFSRGSGALFETRPDSLLDLGNCPVCACPFVMFSEQRRHVHLLLHFPPWLVAQAPVFQTLMSDSHAD